MRKAVILHFAISTLSAISIASEHGPSAASPDHHFLRGDVEIVNSVKTAKIETADFFTKGHSQWIRAKISRRDYIVFPRHCHLHVAFYDFKGNKLAERYRALTEFDFAHTPTGRHRDKVLNFNSEIEYKDIGSAYIQLCESRHND